MKYLGLVYIEPRALARLSPDERAALDRDSLAYDEALQKRGHYVLAAALQSVAETKEVLGGFIFIEARDMDEAVAIAGDIPLARYGSIEVRPELDFA